MNLLPQLAAEGRVTRHAWSATDKDGREVLCLYTAIAGDKDARPWDCPGNFMPQWLAHLLPDLDDRGSEKEWPRMVQRWAAVSDRLGLLVGERGDRLRSRWLAAVLREGIVTPHADVSSYRLGGGVRVALGRLESHGAGEEVGERSFWETSSVLSRLLENTLRGGRESARSAAREMALELSIANDLLPVRFCWDRMTDALLTTIEQEVL